MSDSQLDEESLFDAAKNGRLEEVKRCIASGVDVNCRDEHQATPLYWAARNGQEAICHYLFQQGAKLNVKATGGESLLRTASFNGHPEIVSWLLSKNCKVGEADNGGYTPIHVASSNGFLVIVKELIKKGADVNAKNKEGSTPLHMAAMNGHLQVCKYLLQHGADLKVRDVNGHSPITTACGHAPIVQWLLLKGCQLTETTNDGCTTLHHASSRGHLDVVKLLIDRGANVNSRNKEGVTPFSLAAKNGHLPVCDYLLQQGAELKNRSAKGHTPLTNACSNGHVPVVRWLLAQGCQVSEAINEGDTTLHRASEEGHLEVAKLLIDSGAKVNWKNQNGETPIQLAQKKNHTEMVEYLQPQLKIQQELHEAQLVQDQDITSYHSIPAEDNDNNTRSSLSDERDTSHTAPHNAETLDGLSSGIANIHIENSSNTQTEPQIDAKTIQELQEQFEQQKDHTKKEWSETEKQYFVETCFLHILMAGETFFGKTSIARSLLLKSPYTTNVNDRTRVLDYWSLKIDDNSSVTLYDLGGHNSYKALSHLFHNNCPQNLTMIPHDINNENYSITCQWLTDIITRSPNMQVWLLLTKYDLLNNSDDIKQRKEEFIAHLDKYLEDETKSLNRNFRALSDLSQKSHVKNIIEKYDFIRKELNNGQILHLVSCKHKEDIDKLHSSIFELLKRPNFKVHVLPQVRDLYIRLGKLGLEQAAEKLEASKQKARISGKKSGESEPNNLTERSNQSHDKNTTLSDSQITRMDQEQAKVDEHEQQHQLQEHIPFLQYVKFEDLLVIYQEILSEKGLLSQTSLENDLEEALQTLNSHGLILWYSGTKKLRNFIFNDIGSFVNMLKSLFVLQIEELYCESFSDDDERRKYIDQNFLASVHDQSVSRLSKQGLMDVPLLKTLTSKFDFHEHHDVVVDLLQHLSIAHRTTDDNFIFFPWYLSDSTPEDIDSLVTEMKTFTKETVCWQISLQGHLPCAFFHVFCVQVYEYLLPDTDIQKRKVCKNHLSARIDDVEILIHHQKRENVKDQINVHVKSPVHKPAFDKSWQFIHECEKAFNHLRKTWWYGFGSYLTFECPSCPLHGETCNGSWPLNTLTSKTSEPNKKYSCPKKENRIFPAALICKLSTNDGIAAECLKELCQHLNNCQSDPEYGKRDLKVKESQHQVSDDAVTDDCLQESCQHLKKHQPDREYNARDLKDREDKESQQQMSDVAVAEKYFNKPEANQKYGESVPEAVGSQHLLPEFPSNVKLHRLAANIGNEIEYIASILGIKQDEVERIQRDHNTAHNQNFQILLNWRERSREDAGERCEILMTCMRQVGRESLVTMIDKCYKEYRGTTKKHES